MHRREFLKGLGAGFATLLIAPTFEFTVSLEKLKAESESLASLIEKAKPDQFIFISPGQYWSDRPIQVPARCGLIGRGVDCTVYGDWPAIIGRDSTLRCLYLVDCDIHNQRRTQKVKSMDWRNTKGKLW